MEALKSPLMGLFEKCRARKFFIYVQNYNESDPKTHEGMDLTRILMSQAQHLRCLHTLRKHFETGLGLYAESLAHFLGGSPYIYPLYGLGELPRYPTFHMSTHLLHLISRIYRPMVTGIHL
ncbi:hypothetical protein JHK87_018749 [Glycine soja]|nr:hypothetical protein JHK87_018749 [Glycine soja]